MILVAPEYMALSPVAPDVLQTGQRLEQILETSTTDFSTLRVQGPKY